VGGNGFRKPSVTAWSSSILPSWSKASLSIACMPLFPMFPFPKSLVGASKPTPKISWMRISARAEQILAFLDDLSVPFTNTLAERDLRMIKVQQKISGTFRESDREPRLFAPFAGTCLPCASRVAPGFPLWLRSLRGPLFRLHGSQGPEEVVTKRLLKKTFVPSPAQSNWLKGLAKKYRV
jgi:Transposase IS66 family